MAPVKPGGSRTGRKGSLMEAAGPQVGDPAPPFRLRHTFDHEVELTSVLARGPVVLAFYVFDYGFA